MSGLFEQTDDEGPSLLVAILDTETTGMSASAEVIELAIVLLECDELTARVRRIRATYHGLQEPKGTIDPGAQYVHGISFDDVRGKKFDERRVRTLLESAAFVVAHNCDFDRGMLSRHFHWIKALNWRCSCWHIPWKSLGFPNAQMQTLLKAHTIDPGAAHRATGDVEALAELLQRTHPKSGKPYMWHLLLEDARSSANRTS